MDSSKFSSYLSITEMDYKHIQKARRLFAAYRSEGVILGGDFSDDIWVLSRETATATFDFTLDENDYKPFGEFIKMSLEEFVETLKAYCLYNLGELVIGSLHQTIYEVKKLIKHPVESIRANEKIDGLNYPYRVSDFFSILPGDGREDELLSVQKCIDMSSDGPNLATQRELAAMDSYIRFDELLNEFWTECEDGDKKVFYFPVYLWWKVTGIIPTRPCEFLLIPRNCLKKINGKWYLSLRKSKLKGRNKPVTHKVESDYETVQHEIPEELANEITWYLDRTKGCILSPLNTLFVMDVYYQNQNQNTPCNSKYFSYNNLNSTLRKFYAEYIIEEKGYEIVSERDRKYLNSNQIQYLYLGDTRHLAMINAIFEGTTPEIAMILAGHDNPSISAHYFSNITKITECRVYRQFKKQIKGTQAYSVSQRTKPLQAVSYTLLPDNGRCYSPRVKHRDFTDCFKVSSRNGEIGNCALCGCTYYRPPGKAFGDSRELYTDRISEEQKVLLNMINRVRKENGNMEDVISSLMRLQEKEYSYAQYLMETMDEKDMA